MVVVVIWLENELDAQLVQGTLNVRVQAPPVENNSSRAAEIVAPRPTPAVTKPPAAAAPPAPVLTPVAQAVRQAVAEPAAAPAAPAAAATNFTSIKVGPGGHINNIAKRMLESAKNGQEVRASWGDQTVVANKNSTVAEILAQRSNPAVTKAPAPTH